MDESSFQFAFYGEGYTEEQDPTKGKPNGKIRILIQGPGNSKSKFSVCNTGIWSEHTLHLLVFSLSTGHGAFL